ncbi:OmpA family protein [Neotamlana laminarinivorans]|uniref:OmpA family protein n=1 Tax=Neotamlana laminarinivorans TaxID=2883124 RepID=A0A9X1I4A0_9FLAO|nr:OmpA family protein [Tamlana laminarinivorans]MCB4799937.1 OmpA family protein [Tamlana laminarinivorans]
MRKIYLYILLLIPALSVNAQEKLIKKISKKNYDNLAYVKTSEVFLEVAEKGHESEEMFKKLGNSFYFNNEMESASKWYGKLMEIETGNLDPEYYFRYAQALKGIGNYELSDQWMRKFEAQKPQDLRAKAFASTEDYLSKIEKISYKDAEVKNLEINSELSDFGSTLYNGNLIFSSSRGTGELYSWNEQPYLDLYSAEIDAEGNFSKVNKFGLDINTKYHESSAAYTPDGKYLFFTRNNYFKSRYSEDDKKFNRLQIYRAEIDENGGYNNLTSVHFNNDEYSVAHPTINKEGTKMYFASDMPGSTGQSDIYVVNINQDGTLGEPENLGITINTEGAESFPFISDNGDLYFSSTGYPGLGGLDVYVVKSFESQYSSSESRTFKVQNIGKPFNSKQDDFAYYINDEKGQGYFTSNRKGGKGDDDIYAFNLPECKQELQGVLKDAETQEVLAKAKVILQDALGNIIAESITDKKGAYSLEVSCDTEYLIRGEKVDYESSENRFVSTNRFEKLTQDLNLVRDVKPIQVGDDLAKTLNIPIIYFDFDKHNIRPDAAVELEKVIAVLKQYPTMEIEVRSHTDSRATKVYNEALSTRRNKSTKVYIIEEGQINPDRITGAGYGESQLVNGCSDGVKCSEEDHQLNRRSEFIIIKM